MIKILMFLSIFKGGYGNVKNRLGLAEPKPAFVKRNRKFNQTIALQI